MKSKLRPWLLSLALVALGGEARAAGTLTPVGSPDAPIQIRNHHAQVVINNGFAHTEVVQTFFNPNPVDLEGIYAFPVPRSASLSEVSITSGETEIHGEVIAKHEAQRIYEEERDRGNSAGLASKNEFETYEFRVTPIRANSETRLRFVYYQPLEIDTGVGRFLYPLEDGGTDELAKSFWTRNETVEGTFSVDLELKSAWPVVDVRVPGFENAAQINKLDEGHYQLRLETQGAKLNRDFVFYYRLQDGLPGRVEVVPYRADASKPGTFMMVVTPGIDLQRLTGGSDFVFVLDVSGSMAGKIQTLANGVSKSIGELSADDRFRIVTFNNQAREVTPGWVAATQDNVTHWVTEVGKLQADGGTNLYEGLSQGLDALDADRATSVILVTDAVTNTGVVDPKEFHKLMGTYDIRLFGFLMGNSGNWSLMRTICDATGGFFTQISNADDILGQIMLAKSKVTHEALHNAEFKIQGVKTFETTGEIVKKIYRGQQLVLFGRYDGSGPAQLTLDASLTGQDMTYITLFDFPEIDTNNPELERLWALSKIEEIDQRANAGLLDWEESRDSIEGLGVEYQLVTDETSMLVLSDVDFDRHAIDRRNQRRTKIEHAAQAQRRNQPVVNRRVDQNQPMFDRPAPTIGGGGGAIDPVSGLIALGLGGAAWKRRRDKLSQ